MSAGDGARQASDAEQPLASDNVLEPGLVNLADVSLADLRFVDGSPIARVIARLVEEAIDPGDATAGFQSAV